MAQNNDKFKKMSIWDLVDFIFRNAIWVAVILFGAWIIQPDTQLIKTLAMIVLLEGIALGLSGIALFIYTNYHITKYFLEGDDKQMNSVERHAGLEFAGRVFLGVHLLVGLSTYFQQFNDKIPL